MVEIDDLGPKRLEEADARSEHELGKRRAVDGRQRQPDEAERVVDAVFGTARPVGLLGREADRVGGAVAEEGAELVLRGDDRDLGARLREGGEDRLGTQEARLVHHHFLARLGVEEVVARDAVHPRAAPR